MRNTDANSYWLKLRNRKPTNAIKKIYFANLPGFEDGWIEFAPSISLICGPNGIGKTTLAHLISSHFENYIQYSESSSNRITNSNSCLDYFYRGNDYSHLSSAKNKIPNPLFIYISVSSESSKMIDYISKLPDFDDIIASTEPKLFKAEEISEVGYIVGKVYEEISAYDLTDTDFSSYRGPLPYFSVKVNGNVYKSEDMGLGEYSLIYTYWCLINSSKGSIMLLEEPESHISIKSQSALLNVIAKYAIEKSLYPILVTHSPEIPKLIDVEKITVLYHTDRGSKAISHATKKQIIDLIGINTAKKGVFIVEDRAAELLMTSIASIAGLNLNDEYFVHIVKDCQNVTKITQLFEDNKFFKVIGVLDGNERRRIDKYDFTGNLTILPSDLEPENYVKKIIEENLDDFASITNINVDNMRLAISNFTGQNLHDWLPNFTRAIERDQKYVVMNAILVGHKNDAQKYGLIEFIENVRKIIER